MEYFKRFLKKTYNIRKFLDLWPVIIIGAFVLAAIFAGIISPHDPAKNELSDMFLAPIWSEDGSSTYILGTDHLGRDILSRIIHGARISLGLALITILISASFGSFLGLLAGFRGGLTETIIMRLVDIILALPVFLIAIVVAATLGPSLGNVMGIIALLLWPYFARQLRGETLGLRHAQFVEAAASIGASNTRIMFRHILPNLLPSIIIFSTLQVNLVIVIEASLSFLGIGIPPPASSWGRMVSDGLNNVYIAWWAAAIPGIVISIVVLSIAFLGDTLRDRLDPVLRGR